MYIYNILKKITLIDFGTRCTKYKPQITVLIYSDSTSHPKFTGLKYTCGMNNMIGVRKRCSVVTKDFYIKPAPKGIFPELWNCLDSKYSFIDIQGPQKKKNICGIQIFFFFLHSEF